MMKTFKTCQDAICFKSRYCVSHCIKIFISSKLYFINKEWHFIRYTVMVSQNELRTTFMVYLVRIKYHWRHSFHSCPRFFLNKYTRASGAYPVVPSGALSVPHHPGPYGELPRRLCIGTISFQKSYLPLQRAIAKMFPATVRVHIRSRRSSCRTHNAPHW